ncbi:MAG: hypothetical protein WBL93_09210 [Lutisporaceae bacterium]
MKKHVFFHQLLILIISVAMIFGLTSCAQRKPIPIPSKSGQNEQSKPPKELDELNKAVEKMETTLFEMHERSKKPLFIQQSEIQKQSGQSQQNQQSKSSSGSSGSSEQQPSQIELVSPQEKLLETKYEIQQMQLQVERANMEQFEQLKKDVLKLHSMWNAFEAKAMNQLLIQSSLLDFETALNDLTKSIESNNVYQSLMDVIQLYKYLPDFYMAYAFESPPEIGKIRYGAKKIVLLTEKNKYPEAKETLDYITGVWMLTRPRLSKDSLDLINKFEFSISDLKDAIDAKNPMVVKAKTEVMIKVADEIEKESKKQAK